MDPTACREALAALIAHEISSLDTLAALLEREHGLLVANDVAALEAAMAEQICVGTLARVEDERRSLCRMHGHPAPARSGAPAGLVRSVSYSQGSLGQMRLARCALVSMIAMGRWSVPVSNVSRLCSARLPAIPMRGALMARPVFRAQRGTGHYD